jgi:hypothetical protein
MVCGTNCCIHILIIPGKGDVMFDEDPQDTMESDAFGTENGGAECIWTAE